MEKTAVLEKIEKVENELADLKKLVTSSIYQEEQEVVEAIRVYEKEKKAGQLIKLANPEDLLK